MGYNNKNIKKVLFVVHNFIEEWTAGVENYTFALAKELVRVGVNVSFLYPKIEENSIPKIEAEIYEGIEVYRLKTTNSIQLFTELEGEKYNEIFDRFLLEKKFDIVHFHHFYGLPLSFAEVVKKRNIKLFITLHDFWLVCPRIHFFINEKNKICNVTPNAFYCAECLSSKGNFQQQETFKMILNTRENYVKDILNSADYISAPSEFTAEKFSHLNIFKEIHIVPLGLEHIEVKSQAKNSDELIFGYIGSIAPVKNVMMLVEIFKEISPRQKLLIYGNGGLNEIEALQNSLKDFPNIEYRGAYVHADLGDIFGAVDVIIVPSFIETYSFTVREALSANKPVIVSGVGGILDIVTNNKNGLLFSPFDKKEMKSTIEKVVKNPGILNDLVKEKTIIPTINEDAEFWRERYQENPSKPKVSIIIPVYNKIELTQNCISTIFENTVYPNYEIIIVDNNSTDGTKEYLAKLMAKHDNIKVIFNNTNLGFAKANNLAARKAKGKYLHLLNNDTQVQKYWLSSLVELAESDSSIYAVGSKLLFPNKTIQHIGVVVFSDEMRVFPIHLYYKFPRSVANIKHPKFFQVLTAASLLIRKTEFFKVKGFDEDYWNGYEDVDLCFKLHQLGGNLVLEPRSVVMHYESQSGHERFVATKKNEQLLNQKWGGKVEADFIIEGSKSKKNNRKTFCSYFPDRIEDKRASIIIVTYNSEQTITSCLTSVLETVHSGDEIIIVDNNSSDNTLNILSEFERKNSNIKVLAEKENHGFSKGCNLGIEAGSNPFIVLLNPDTVVYGNWLEKLIVHFNNPKVGAVGPVSDYVAGNQKYFLYSSLEFTGNNIAEVNNSLEALHKNVTVNTKLLIGFCMVLKRKILNKCGLLDERLFLGNDDLEISWRLRLFGYKLVVSPDTFVAHLGQHSFNSFDEERRKEFTRESTQALYKKLEDVYGVGNVPPPEKLWGMNWFSPEHANFNHGSKLHSVQENWKEKFNIEDKNIIVSVIVPVYNQKDVTQEFLTSIGEFIPKYLEVIIIDNNSEKKTKEFLQLYTQSTDNVILISNTENLGFPKAINQGLRIARGKYILIANNDIILPSDWLRRMIFHAEQSNEIGIVGPVSNKVSGVQLLKEAKYRTMDEMREFARGVADKFNRQRYEFPRVAFLCTLIKKEVIEKIGGLDERFSPGNYEDDDYCLRAQLAGFKTVIALDVFVHHYGSKSFTAEGKTKYHKLLEINEKKFVDKWGATPDEIWLKGKKLFPTELYFPLNRTFIDYVNLANKALNNEQYEESLSNLDKAINSFDEKTGVKVTDLLLLASKIAKLLNRYEAAEKYLQMFVNVANDNADVFRMLGEISESKGKLPEAIAYYEESVKIFNSSELKRKIYKLKNNLLIKS